jgi:Cof subfamily protein (haloacid dehalogenase superfamily)
MSQPEIRLVAVDEDGTFMRPDNSFDQQRFARVWERMGELGVRFVVATGNQHHQVRQLFGPRYAHQIGIVAENGAYVADGDEELWAGSFEPGAVATIVREMDAVGAPVLLDGVKAAYASTRAAQDFCDDLATYFPVMERVDDLTVVDDRIVMASTVVPESDCDAIMARLAERLGTDGVPVPSGEGYFDVLLPGTTKATGVARLAERWGVEPGQCACFGNSYNDLEMVEWAGLGVFMANAPEDLKPRADLIAPPYDQDGVLQVLEDLFL